MNKPRVYRHSPLDYLWISMATIPVGILIFFTIFLGNDLTLAAMIGVPFLFIMLHEILFLSNSVTVSDTEITTKNILSEKTLAWREIQRVIGSTASIKLKNFDGDVAISISPQTPGCEEIIESLGAQRPDLFASPEFNFMERRLTVSMILGLVMLVFLGRSSYLNLQGESSYDSPWILYILFAVVIITFVATYLVSPKSIALEGNTLLIQYPFKETAWRANEIEAVQLRYANTRQKNFFVNVFLTCKKSVKIPSLGPGVIVTYLVLNGWHKRQTNHNFSV
jgi:hypothetical protein